MAPRGSSARSQALRQRSCSIRDGARGRSLEETSFASAEASSSSRLLELPLDLILAIVRKVPPNDVACSLRLCCSALRDALASPEHSMVRLSAPVQPHAFDWALRHGFTLEEKSPGRHQEGRPATKMLDGLTFDEKILLSKLVAGTGVLPNLVALHRTARCPGNCSSPRAAAALSHLHVLQWLEAEGSCLCCVRVQQAVGSLAALAVLQWYADRQDAHPPTLFAAACEDDDPARRAAKLQYMYDRYGNDVVTRRATAAAARRGDVATLAWLKERGGTVDAMTLVAAAGGGDVAAAAWVHANGGMASLAAIHEAASEGRVAMMEWLAERQDVVVPAARWRRVLAAAAGGGHGEAVAWLVRKVEADQEALEAAAEGGHCEVIRVLLARGSRPSAEAFGLAAKAGSIGSMQLLLDAAAATTATTGADATAAATVDGPPAVAAAAASGGGGSAAAAAVDIMRPPAYMAASLSVGGGGGGGGGGADGGGGGCPARSRNCVLVLQWLEARGCPLGEAADREETMVAAALRGSQARVEWLRARGLSWSARTFAAAAASGCIQLVEWMAAQGCPMGRRGDALLAAGANSDAAMLAALRRLGCPWSADVLARAVRGVLQLGTAAGAGGAGLLVRCRWEVLRWMVEHGCPVTKQAYQVAKRCGREDVADWIKRSGQMH